MKSFSRKSFSVMIAVGALAMGSMAVIPAAIAAPQTFTVNVITDEGDANPGDGTCETANAGECSYRAALEEANANVGADTVEFNISGAGVHTIIPQTPLPLITDQIFIDGFSQPGASANTAIAPAPLNGTILIEIDGSVAVAAQTAGVAFGSGSANSSVKGLSIFDASEVDGSGPIAANILVGASDVLVGGNYIGIRADGATVGTGGNDTSILITAAFGPFSNPKIGSASPEDRNVIYSFSNSNVSAGIFGGTDGLTVYGNYIGVASDGVTDLTPGYADTAGLQGPYSMGMNLVEGTGAIVGGPSSGQANLISGGTVGVIFSSSNNKLQGNLIGTDYTGQVNENFTNGAGFTTTPGAHNLVGGTNPGEGNIFAGLSGGGILVSSFLIEDIDGNGSDYNLDPQSISILGNSVYDIEVFNYTTDLEAFGDMNQGIDLVRMIDHSSPGDFVPDEITFRGPTPNDVGDADDGPNGFMNFPVLRTAQQVGQNLDITFDLDVAGSPTDQYRVEFFANDRSTIFGAGPGQTLLGFANVSNGTAKNATLNLGSVDVVGKSLSATVTPIDATELYGFGGTSEFAYNISVGSAGDFDSDGVSDVEEDAAPNNGDGNDDGIADSIQATVSSFEISNSTTYTTFVTNGCSENGTVSSLSEDNLVDTDGNLEYPFGLTDFSLNCSRGATVNVTKYVFTDISAEGLSVRKYRADSPTHFIPVTEATLVNDVVGGQDVLVMDHPPEDGGALDDDGIANGVIVDPVGIASVKVSSTSANNPNGGSGSASGSNSTSANGLLASTGANTMYEFYIAMLMMLLGGMILGSSKGTRLVLARVRK